MRLCGWQVELAEFWLGCIFRILGNRGRSVDAALVGMLGAVSFAALDLTTAKKLSASALEAVAQRQLGYVILTATKRQ
jgi:hypothetical protein